MVRLNGTDGVLRCSSCLIGPRPMLQRHTPGAPSCPRHGRWWRWPHRPRLSGAKAPRLVRGVTRRLHRTCVAAEAAIRARRQTAVNMEWRCRGRSISLILRWADAKAMAMVEYGGDHGGKASIWLVTCDTVTTHVTSQSLLLKIELLFYCIF